jgi:hypothetical protein
MQQPSVVIVHESKPYWGPILQREFLETTELAIRWVPHWIDLAGSNALKDSVVCVCVLEGNLPPAATSVLTELAAATNLIVVARPLPPTLEWSLRELGAASILESPISVSQMVRTLRRQLQSGAGPQGAEPAEH